MDKLLWCLAYYCICIFSFSLWFYAVAVFFIIACTFVYFCAWRDGVSNLQDIIFVRLSLFECGIDICTLFVAYCRSCPDGFSIRRTIYGTYLDPKCSRRCGWFFAGGCRELKKWTPKSSECATEVYLQPRCNSPMWALSFFSPSPVRRDRPGIQSRGRKIPLNQLFVIR